MNLREREEIFSRKRFFEKKKKKKKKKKTFGFLKKIFFFQNLDFPKKYFSEDTNFFLTI